MAEVRKHITDLISDARGSIAIVASLGFFALMVASGMAVDYAVMIRQKAELQVAADAAAVAGAKEIPMAMSDTAHIMTVASNYARANLEMSVEAAEAPEPEEDEPEVSFMKMDSAPQMMMASAKMADDSTGVKGSPGGGSSGITITANVLEDDNTVEVVIEKEWKPFFASFLPTSVTKLSVTARAQIMSSGKICVLGLMPSNFWAGIHLEQNASLRAPSCGVYSNSTSFSSIRADSDSQLEAETICAAGGTWGTGPASFTPAPSTDCPVVPDPLSSRPTPTVGSCTAIDLEITEDTTLSPGTYCGGIKISDDSQVKLQPGVYVIKDGPLEVEDSASFSGEYVGIYLTGTDSTFKFDADTTIDLGAPSDGAMAGLLFMEDSAVTGLRVHEINSNFARQLLGTIYLPKSVLKIAANAPVADQSAYTAIVVLRLWLQEGPTLVLNADYSATDVPVPKAISGGQVILTQ